ncbi:MAG: hypothetical protein GC185_00410 [Alphaproteobacteria bacterium]|nr:hypothetical protein [Alphaproteobacteria bacterium]
MAKLTKSFNEAYQQGARGGGKFTKTHEQLIDALQSFVDELNADGQFTAKLGGFTDETPTLKIKETASGLGQTFFIGYGWDVFGGSPTLQLSTGLQRTPVGDKKDGYSIQVERERDQLFTEVGKSLAAKIATLKTGAKTVQHIRNRQTPGA